MTDQDAEGALQAQIDEAKASGDIAKASELYRQQIGNVDPYGDEAAARCGAGGSGRRGSRAKSMLRSPRRQIDNLGSALALAPHGGSDAQAVGLVGGALTGSAARCA